MRVIAPVIGTGTPTRVVAASVPGTGPGSFQERLGSAGRMGPSASEPAFSGEEILRHAAQEMRSMLRLQYQLSNGKNSLISNLMKTRHETAKNAISNIR